jgi:Dolichyl-phosphate-mannose-protein mannosyltransferase
LLRAPAIVVDPPLPAASSAGRPARFSLQSAGFTLGLALVLFTTALLPRALVVPTMVTADEDTWLGLAGNFAQALSSGKYARTYQLGHPGVTSLWVDILGLGIGRAAQLADLVEHEGNTPTRRAATNAPDFLPALAAARWAHAVANACLVSLVGLLAAGIFGRPVGLLAGLLLALDPFLIAHAQVIRMDSLQALLLCIALLAGLARVLGAAPRRFVALSGAAFGLALLSKSSSIVALPVLLFLGLVEIFRRVRRQEPQLTRCLVVDTLFWIACAATSFVLLWPAMWVAPVQTLQRLADFARWNSGTVPLAGNFFFGSVVADPGPFFYPVALAFRVTPLVCLGLLLLAFPAWRRQDTRRVWIVAALLGCALFFLLAISGAPKKFDRYLLPLLPLLLVAAAVGLSSITRLPGQVRPLLLALLALASVHQLASVPPANRYPLAYFNPLVGGPALASRTILVGWGEGMELAAAHLNELPGGDDLVVAAFHENTFDASLNGSAIPLRRFAEADYLVLPIDAQQRQLLPLDVAAYLAEQPGKLVLPLAGLDYVTIYRLPHLEFGDRVSVIRFTTEGTEQPLGYRLRIDVVWQALNPADAGVSPIFQFVDESGTLVGNPVRPTLNAPAPASVSDQLHGTVRLESPRQRGTYRLAISIANQDGTALPVTKCPPWTELSGNHLIVNAAPIRYR